MHSTYFSTGLNENGMSLMTTCSVREVLQALKGFRSNDVDGSGGIQNENYKSVLILVSYCTALFHEWFC